MVTFEQLSDLDGQNIIFSVGGLTIKHNYNNMSVARHSANWHLIQQSFLFKRNEKNEDNKNHIYQR